MVKLIEISVDDLIIDILHSLNLESSLSILSKETISEFIRKICGYYCPCTKIKIIKTTIKLLKEFTTCEDELNNIIRNSLEDLFVQGDILESKVDFEGEDNIKTMVFLSPLKFVKLSENKLLLLGIVPDNKHIIPDEISKKLKYHNSSRFIENPSSESVDQLVSLGFLRLSLDEWLKFNQYPTAAAYLEKINAKLTKQKVQPESIENLKIIDKTNGRSYYKERWKSVNQTYDGLFVGRRSIQYGADLWCYFELKEGIVQRFVDLPSLNFSSRGCDEAWRIQLAIDRVNNSPQTIIFKEFSEQNILVKIFSPLPNWAIRFLDVQCKRTTPDGCLLAYLLSRELSSKVENFFKENLWIDVIN